jgi:transposase
MKARIACEQRLRRQLIGKVFCQQDGLYPEGSIEVMFDQAKANDTILQSLLAEEKRREKELLKATEALDVYNALFKPIEGCGYLIAARIIAAVIDIRRFKSSAQLKAFCGVHVLADGQLPRRRHGQVANWNPTTRQALYLLAEQFNRRPNSIWGKKLLTIKEKIRQVHPKVEMVNGKRCYSKGHIHKMALWRTVTKFVEWLWREWWRLEKQRQIEENSA